MGSSGGPVGLWLQGRRSLVAPEMHRRDGIPPVSRVFLAGERMKSKLESCARSLPGDRIQRMGTVSLKRHVRFESVRRNT